ncbi:hypothetical protein ACFSJW_24335 [Flavobacterium artemisiae]|uniref:Uncharacterized protein n=1 Tax=Flavobacterium artemisiae TaxID=2126556 RepID=A0ABW4H999_9FLAO
MNYSKKEQQIWERWITIEDYHNYPQLADSLADFEGSHLLCYVYIDHDAGTTLDVVKIFNKVDDKIEFTESLIDKQIRVIMRYSDFSEIPYEILSDTSLGNFELIKPQHLKFYDRDDLIDFRKHDTVNYFRAEGYPDDIQILLFSENDYNNPELVWGRVEKYNITTYIGVAILLVQPHQNFGINKNEPLAFALRTFKEKLAIIGIVDGEKAKTKPWWKIW